MSANRIVIALGVIAASISVALSLQGALRAQDGNGKPHAAAPAPVKKSAQSRLEHLPCFGCHNIEHYLKGKPRAPGEPAPEEGEPSKEFSHTLHQQEVGGHCHVCHALEGHFQVTIRKETCAGCH